MKIKTRGQNNELPDKMMINVHPQRWGKDGSRWSEVGGHKTGVGSQESEVGKKRKGFENFRFRSTFAIIEAAEKGLLPDKMMINTHPQRWTDNPVQWTKELVWQNFKNVIKRTMLAYRDKK